MCKCIIVDDDQLVIELLEECITSLGWKVIAQGKDGKEAVELYKKYVPDVVFLDFEMPEYDGIYAIDEIMKFHPEAKIIIVSGSDNISEKVSKWKINSIIQKPVTFDAIKNRIEIIESRQKWY